MAIKRDIAIPLKMRKIDDPSTMTIRSEPQLGVEG
jgi:hypothetical protein